MVEPLRISATRGSMSRAAVASTESSSRVTARAKHIWGGSPGSEMWVVFGHSRVPIGHDRLLSVSIAIGNTVVRAPFRGASPEARPEPVGIYRHDDALVWFGPLYPDQFGLSEFPAGMVFWSKAEAGMAWPGDEWADGDWLTEPGEAVRFANRATTPSELMSPGPLSLGDLADPLTVLGMMPLAILGRCASYELAVIQLGDSNMAANGASPGTRTFGDGTSGGSYAKRALRNVHGRTIPWCIQAQNGITAWQMQERLATLSLIWPYATHIVVQLGTNDLVGTAFGLPVGRTAAEAKTALVGIFGEAKAKGLTTIWSKVPPATTSTDGWKTLANQTPFAGFEAGGALRDPLIASMTAASVNSLDYVFDLHGWQDTVATDKWKLGACDDGTHGTVQAHAEAGAALAAYFATQGGAHP